MVSPIILFLFSSSTLPTGKHRVIVSDIHRDATVIPVTKNGRVRFNAQNGEGMRTITILTSISTTQRRLLLARSASVASSSTAALAFVKAKRPQVAPADVFKEAIERWLSLDKLATRGPRQ